MPRDDWRAGLRPLGLEVLGELQTADRRTVLVGNAGSAVWPVLTASPEFRDREPDPMDRWSRRIGRDIARQAGAEVRFPFEGPPWPPFQAWASAAGASFRSPLGLQIHARFGLWHAYRFALVFEEPGSAVAVAGVSPCLDCSGQPCLTACPVEAFTAHEYRVEACTGHLESPGGSACMTAGCLARHACPVATDLAYHPDHAAFHMNAFFNAQRRVGVARSEA